MTDISASLTDSPKAEAAKGVAHLHIGDRDGTITLRCSGNWACSGIHAVDRILRELKFGSAHKLIIDTRQTQEFDSSGAWLVERTRRAAQENGLEFEHQPADAHQSQLLEVIRAGTLHDEIAISDTSSPARARMSVVGNLGRAVSHLGRDFIQACNIIGASLRGTAIKSGARGGIRVTSVVNQIDHMAIRSIPVIGVMSFLIGAIIAQQSAYQLKFFGEELLTINLVGILHLREIGVLLTAVMVAGRTGSAITAEIGSMKMREEVDALRVIGLNPIGVLVVPRLLALIIALPLLTLLADLAGLLGAMVVMWTYVGVEPVQFLESLRTAIDHTTLFAGLIKAPFMAFIIGLIATLEGLKVKGSAESLGQRTTSSVVRSIFAVIFIDGLFAIFYASIGF